MEPAVEEEAKVQVVVVQMIVGAAEAGAKVVQVMMEVLVLEALTCALGSVMVLVASMAEVFVSPSVFTSCTNKIDKRGNSINCNLIRRSLSSHGTLCQHDAPFFCCWVAKHAELLAVQCPATEQKHGPRA